MRNAKIWNMLAAHSTTDPSMVTRVNSTILEKQDTHLTNDAARASKITEIHS